MELVRCAKLCKKRNVSETNKNLMKANRSSDSSKTPLMTLVAVILYFDLKV